MISSDSKADTSCTDRPFPGIVANPCATVLVPLGIPPSSSSDDDGVLGGVQAGYNWQLGNLVIGAEADFSWTDISSDSIKTRTVGLTETVAYNRDIDSLGTVRARAGWAAGDFLIFATGGLAYADVTTSYNYTLPTQFNSSAEKSSTELGWTLGGGVEWKIGTWSIKGEYLYFDLGDQKTSGDLKLDQPPPNNTGINFNTKSDVDGHIARVGLNYHFD